MAIYDQLGQEQGITVAVTDFYRRVLGDPDLEGYFAGVDTAQVQRHQVALLSTVTGGPQQYSGRALDVSHRHLGITHDHFDRVVGHLGATLDALGVAPDVRDQVAAALVAQRSHIVSEREPVH